MSCVEELDGDGGCKPVLSVVELVGHNKGDTCCKAEVLSLYRSYVRI